ncbi:MAG TPA: metallophosphoesterase [bacterium]|nr:metallophosphoesterase [bacterium]HPN93970.1 metallophosphoesterase [bacterium]
MEFITRREFIKSTGIAAASAVSIAFLPGIAFSASSGEAAFAASAVIQPSFAAPAIALSGQSFPFRLSPSGARASIDSAWIASPGGKPFILSVENGHFIPTVPPPPGMYDLYLEVSMGASKRFEKQPLAVKIVEQFKTDYCFGAISDVHFGDPRISSMIKDFSVEETFKKEIQILNENQIEFCVCCGDLSFLPPRSKKEIIDYADALTSAAKYPTFSVPGNHDGYTSGAGGKINFDTLAQWTRSFGVLDYSASYGETAILGVNTYNASADKRNIFGGLGEVVDSGYVTDEQLVTLDAMFAEAKKTSKLTIALGHHNPTNTVKDVNGPFEIVPFTETGRLELLSLFEKRSLDYFFCGHVHGIYRERYANTEIVTVPTAASRPADGHPLAIYLVKVSDGKISDIETVKIAEL